LSFQNSCLFFDPWSLNIAWWLPPKQGLPELNCTGQNPKLKQENLLYEIVLFGSNSTLLRV